MAKQKKKINKIDSTNLILYIAYGVVTLTAIVFIVLLTFAPFKVTSYDSLQQVEYKEYDNQKDEAYFVLIYDESRPNSNWNLEVVMQYANKARLHSEFLPIYGYDLQEKGNSKLESELGLKGVPALLRIENGSVKNTYTNWADINNTLIDELEK